MATHEVERKSPKGGREVEAGIRGTDPGERAKAVPEKSSPESGPGESVPPGPGGVRVRGSTRVVDGTH